MKRKPPKDFSESFQFIQDMFQQGATELDKKAAKATQAGCLKRLVSWGLMVLISTLVALLIYYLDISAIIVSEQGIWLPWRSHP